jgi:hypothetical protein
VGPSFLLVRIDPGRARQAWLGWWLADEALEVGKESGVPDLGAPGPDDFGLAVVEVGGGVQVEPAMAVLIVEQRKNSGQCARAASIEGNRKGRPVFQDLELGLRVEVGVADVRPGVGLGDAQVGQQQRDRRGRHRGAAAGVQAELTRMMPLLGRSPR